MVDRFKASSDFIVSCHRPCCNLIKINLSALNKIYQSGRNVAKFTLHRLNMNGFEIFNVGVSSNYAWHTIIRLVALYTNIIQI